MASRDPHADAPVLEGGAPLARAKAAVVLLHGRGATAESILTLTDEFAQPDVAYLAPQAASVGYGPAWYPHSFLAPLGANEPWLSSALAAVGRVVAQAEAGGIPPERIVLMGFSQGACLASEYAARNARRWGGVVALSGGLIGNGEDRGVDPPMDKRFEYEGSFDGTPAFFGCSDRDPHIPAQRVHDSAAAFRRMGAAVDERIYEGMGHTVNEDEVRAVRGLLAGVQAA
jgi:phospholipase/carboxylesterase